jgi:hypothetical protein
VSGDELLVIALGVVAIAAVNWWFLGKWPGHEALRGVHDH